MQLPFPSSQESPQQKSQLLSFKQKKDAQKRNTYICKLLFSVSCLDCEALLIVCVEKKKNISKCWFL